MQSQTQDNKQFHWQLNVKILVFVVIFFPLTIVLGFWQLSRAEEKQQLLDEYHAREVSGPVPVNDLKTQDDQQYRRVSASGEFDNRFTVLLENRIRKGRPGFQVVTLFKLEDNARPIWVNRGWIAGYLDRNHLPEVPRVEGPVTLFGHLYRPLKAPFVVGEEIWRSQWPQVLQNLDRNLLSARMNFETYPYQLRLDQASRGALQTGWDVVNILPERHQGYAVQWFAMATALMVLALFANSNLATILFAGKR